MTVVGDEPGIAGLGVADRAGDRRVLGEIRERGGDLRLEGLASRVGVRRAAVDRDQRGAAGTELVGQAIGDGGGLGVGVEPAPGGEHGRRPPGRGARGDPHDDGEDEDDLAVAVDEGSPAAEHRALRCGVEVMAGSVVGPRVERVGSDNKERAFSLSTATFVAFALQRGILQNEHSLC